MVRVSYNHGRRSRGTRPPEFGVGDVNANCPLIFCHIGTKRSVLSSSKYAKTVFGRGSAPDPAGSSRRSPISHSRLRSVHPFPYPTSLGTDPPLALAMRSPEIQPDLRLFGYDYWYVYNIQSTDYGVGVTDNYWGHLDCQVLRAPQYLNPALLYKSTFTVYLYFLVITF